MPDQRVYSALATFGAPLSAFEVGETDFATYDGMLQMGVPPARIDILNRADGIASTRTIRFTQEKRAAGREQDIADVMAPERLK